MVHIVFIFLNRLDTKCKKSWYNELRTATESQKSLKEVCEGVAGVKNHTKESCRP